MGAEEAAGARREAPEVERLADLIGSAERIVALTGAGVSVPSGIPDFRTPGKGLWSKVDPMKVATIDAFHRDTRAFWEFYRPRFNELGDKRPNPAHQALVDLEAEGLQAVITQNIDRLHALAGSSEVIEVHGSIETSSCTTCGARFELAQVEELFDEDGIATCRGCMGKVKPDVVLFGELLPAEAMDRARELAENADLMICAGSTLEVFPVAGLPELTLSAGGSLAIVTQSATPYDGEAEVKLSGDIAQQLPAVVEAVRAAR